MTHVSQTFQATGGRRARSCVYDNLAWIYQDSGLLGSLMCGALDAPDLIPAGGVRAAQSWPAGQRPALITSDRESMQNEGEGQ